MTYAENTSVPADRSRAEIERTLMRYGAKQFMYGVNESDAVIAFVIMLDSDGEGAIRQVRFTIPLPDCDDPAFTRTPGGRRQRSPSQMLAEYEKATRRVWRALLLVIKAKLEAVESGISEFEQEFLAHIVLPDGKTFGEWAKPEVARAYETGMMPQLALPAGERR